eukprot:6209553-Pleurochrysis_carterae.AAC.2
MCSRRSNASYEIDAIEAGPVTRSEYCHTYTSGKPLSVQLPSHSCGEAASNAFMGHHVQSH